MANPTEKNTKAEILKAYDEMKKKFEVSQSQKVDPAKDIAVKAEKTVIEKAVKATAIDTTTLTNVLLEAVNKLDGITEAYADIEDAIALKNAELKEIYGIEKEAGALFALVNSKQEYADRMDAEYKEAQKHWDIQIENIKAKYRLTAEELEQNRKRDEEQYQYDLKRRMRLDTDKLTDELAMKKSMFDKDIAQIKAGVMTEKDAVEVRERAVAIVEAKLDEYDAVVAQLAKAKDDVRDRAIEVNRIKKEFEYEKNMLTREFEGKLNLATSKIESLQENLADVKALNTELSQKLDTAYNNLRDMANESAKSGSNAATISALKDVARGNQTTK